MKRWACLLLLALAARPGAALTIVMQAWNGSDGPYTDVSMDGNTIHQANDDGTGNYAGFQYYRRPSGSFAAGATLYLEVDYKDLGGPGRIGAQYNAVGNDFQSAGMVLGTSVTNSAGYKTGVMRLDNNNFHFGENGGNDLRLTRTQNLRMHIKEVRVSDTPTAAYLAATAYMGPYTGPTYVGGTPVDATSFTGKMYVGYQGWFRTPADDDDVGWQHWTRSWGNMAAGLISEDFWPQMDELTAAERHAATGYTYPGGAQAELFSSDNARTVLRHFQWMEAYGIDGAAVQRFTNGLASPGSDSFRVISHVRAAANQTGRTYYIEYDMTGTQEADLVNNIANDWHTLVDSLQLPNDPRYLHDGGLPVVGVFGFFPDRFSPATANAILDIFQNGPSQYRAYVAGAGAWYWRTDSNTTPAWQTMLYRMKAWQPWNCGNLMGTYPTQYAKYDYWAADKSDFNAHGVVYQPEIFPGASSANRDGLPPTTQDMPRQGGKFLWDQFVQVHNLGFETVFLGMFDELDEGTQILKVTENYPTQSSFKAYEGMPSDCYLCFAGLGAKMLKGQIGFSTTKPDCPNQTEPSIPDPISPLNGAVVSGGTGAFSWTAALALPGGGSLTRYDVWLDGTVTAVGLVTAASLALAPGNHVWRVRAVNSLGIAGGWSVGQSFSSSGGPTATRTATPAPPATATPTASPSPTRTAVAVGGCGIQAEDYVAYYDGTPGNTGGQYRNDDVDIETCGDAGGGYDVGWTDNGEWLEYLLNVPSTGTYDFSLRVASGNASGGAVQLSIDGSNIGTPLSLPGTGAWQTYQDVTLNAQTLAGGIRRLRVSIVTGGFNLNYLCVKPAATPTPTQTASRTATRSATASATPSITPSRSSTPSSTLSPANTLTATPTRTPSPANTLTLTPSTTASSTLSPANTATSTATRTSSPANTASSTSSATPSSTLSPASTATRTASPVPSVTGTASPTGSPTLANSATPTPTGTLSPANTPSTTASRTSTIMTTSTPTPTGTLSPASTPSATASRTSTLMTTSTATPTSSVSPASSSTPTPSRTPSSAATLTATVTATPSMTVSPPPTHTDTATQTSTATPSQTALPPTASRTQTLLPPPPTAAATVTPSPSATRTPSLSPSETAVPPTLVPTATAVPGGVPRVVQAKPYPNPNPLWLSVQVEGAATQVRVRVFSPARVVVALLMAPANGPGWVRVPLASADLGPGLWHFIADTRDGDPAYAKGSFYILR